MALFKPFQGTSEELLNVGLHPGYVYLTTDDGLLHMDTEEERITLNAKGLITEEGEVILPDEVLTTSDADDLKDVVIINYGDNTITLEQVFNWSSQGKIVRVKKEIGIETTYADLTHAGLVSEAWFTGHTSVNSTIWQVVLSMSGGWSERHINWFIFIFCWNILACSIIQ